MTQPKWIRDLDKRRPIVIDRSHNPVAVMTPTTLALPLLVLAIAIWAIIDGSAETAPPHVADSSTSWQARVSDSWAEGPPRPLECWLVGVTSRVAIGHQRSWYDLGTEADPDLFASRVPCIEGSITTNADATASWVNPNSDPTRVTVHDGSCVVAVTEHCLEVE
jgi:hypothetical protein